VNPIEFQRKWIGVELKERSASQEHFLDICRVIGHQTPAEMDPTGETFTFERGASKAMGGNGWADVWYRDHFAWEYKGRRANLKAAYDQLNLYRESLENPPILVVSDLNKIEIHTNFTGTVKETHLIDLGTFADQHNQHLLRRVFTDPESLKPGRTRASVTQDAAQQFSRIAIGMHERGVAPPRAAHYLVQLLFCLFAEDVNLLPNAIFSKMVAAGVRNPARFDHDAAELLTTMNIGGSVAYEEIPRFNGGLFATVDVPNITADEIRVLHTAAGLDWSAIEPSIFGTLFERSLDPSQRAQLGAHYTGRHDIERVVDPVVMTPLRRRWDAVRSDADALIEQSLAAPSTSAQMSDAERRRIVRNSQNARRRLDTLTRAFQDELAAVRILDPACGSGNFLYVALERLLDLEKEVLTYRANAGLPMGYPLVRPNQVMGLEINEYAQQLAQVAIWIGYLQWMIGNSFTGISEPVLDPLETIRLQDALISTHEDGTVSEAEWPEAEYIIGNPPFLGSYRMRGELGDLYVDALHRSYVGRVKSTADLCCYFFERARAQIAADSTNRAGLLATNSIRGGTNRDVLDRIRQSGSIYMAWPDEPWILNGAAVRISIVGFDDGREQLRHLKGSPVLEINADLTSSVDISSARRLPENQRIAFKGIEKGGPFELDSIEAQRLLDTPPNVNGRPNSDVVRPWRNAIDIAGRSSGAWVIDFGIDRSEQEASMYEAPFEMVKRQVQAARSGNRVERTATQWWIHRRPVPPLHSMLRTLSRYMVTPLHSKYRLFAWLDSGTLPSNALAAFARDDTYFFGVLHSRAHEMWSLRMGTWLGKGNDPRYTPTTCFETYPFPWPPGAEPMDDPRVLEIGEAAAELDRLRRAWLDPHGASEAELKTRTLTNLYNARPTWLQHAHSALDRAVWAAYGWDDPVPSDVEEDVVLSRLLALNGVRANGNVSKAH